MPDHEIERLEFDEMHLEAAETLLRFAVGEDAEASWVVALGKCVVSCRKRHNLAKSAGDRSVYGLDQKKVKSIWWKPVLIRPLSDTQHQQCAFIPTRQNQVRY